MSNRKRTNNRVPIDTLPIGSTIRLRPEGVTWKIIGSSNDVVEIVSDKGVTKYLEGDRKVFLIDKIN